MRFFASRAKHRDVVVAPVARGFRRLAPATWLCVVWRGLCCGHPVVASGADEDCLRGGKFRRDQEDASKGRESRGIPRRRPW